MLVAYVSLRTMLSPDDLLGRVGATARTLSVGLMPVGSLVVGVLLDAIGGGMTLALMGVGLVAAGAGFALRRTCEAPGVPVRSVTAAAWTLPESATLAAMPETHA